MSIRVVIEMANNVSKVVLTKVVNPLDVYDAGGYHVINPMNVQPSWYNTKRMVPVFCKIEYDAEKGSLSISGVVGPLRSGNCVGGCGQINMFITTDYEEYEFTSGWDQIKWEQFLRVWDRWHLNDMRPGCEHQRELGWGKKDLTVVTYELTSKAAIEREKLRRRALDMLEKVGHVSLPPEDQRLLALDWRITVPDDVKVELTEYKFKSKETKRSGWVKPEEHPGGVLCKPCPVCGYKYGTKWLKEDVPRDVIEWLFSLPETLVKPAWV